MKKQKNQKNQFSPLRLFQRDPEASRMQIVRYMTDEEELRNFASPQGLLVNGEVGCGKSMLMDILQLVYHMNPRCVGIIITSFYGYSVKCTTFNKRE